MLTLTDIPEELGVNPAWFSEQSWNTGDVEGDGMRACPWAWPAIKDEREEQRPSSGIYWYPGVTAPEVWVNSILRLFLWFLIIFHSWWWLDTIPCLVSRHSLFRDLRLTPLMIQIRPTHNACPHIYWLLSGIKHVHLFFVVSSEAISHDSGLMMPPTLLR